MWVHIDVESNSATEPVNLSEVLADQAYSTSGLALLELLFVVGHRACHGSHPIVGRLTKTRARPQSAPSWAC